MPTLDYIKPSDIVLGTPVTVNQKRDDNGVEVEVTYIPAALCGQKPMLFFYSPEVSKDNAACMLVFDMGDPMNQDKNPGLSIPMPKAGETVADVLVSILNSPPTDLESALLNATLVGEVKRLRKEYEENREECDKAAQGWLHGSASTSGKSDEPKTGLYL